MGLTPVVGDLVQVQGAQESSAGVWGGREEGLSPVVGDLVQVQGAQESSAGVWGGREGGREGRRAIVGTWYYRRRRSLVQVRGGREGGREKGPLLGYGITGGGEVRCR